MISIRLFDRVFKWGDDDWEAFRLPLFDVPVMKVRLRFFRRYRNFDFISFGPAAAAALHTLSLPFFRSILALEMKTIKHEKIRFHMRMTSVGL